VNAQLLAKTAYAGAAVPTRTGRGTEYELFAQITRRLNAALKRPEENFSALAGALHDNRTLWTTLAADVAEATNGLPQALRARLYYLSEFTRHHTRRVLAREATADVLVEINMAVMRGLRGEGDGA